MDSINTADMTLEQLAALADSSAPEFTKVSNPDPNRDDGVLTVDAEPVEVTITHVTLGARTARSGVTFATPQAVLTLGLSNGRTTQAAIDLPIHEGDGMVLGMSTEEENKYTQKSGEKFLRFLRAINPTTFNVFARLDKETNPWTYYGFDGAPMSHTERGKRASQVNSAVMVVAGLIRKNDYSQLEGKKVMVRRVSSNNPKYPWTNFSAVGE